jgi:hypothetical protein
MASLKNTTDFTASNRITVNDIGLSGKMWKLIGWLVSWVAGIEARQLLRLFAGKVWKRAIV